MRFSKLKLNGFKSFVDSTDLTISDGLTGVVGPNGCGKSNLLEALRWVMGENRPKAMRGAGMDDVIFAGAASRPAKNFAEVSLTVDNSDRSAPKELNNVRDFEVLRRITRDAGSAYKVNGKDARARDVQMLFADASTGAHSPALVRQGQIGELINAKPKARRRILEEAAGISGLYQRRHEAELKLSGAETNLSRVDDTIDQLASQLGQLAKQAKQAIRYREIGEVIRKLEGQILYIKWEESEGKQIVAEAQKEQAHKKAADAELEANKFFNKREESENLMPKFREDNANAVSYLQKLKVEKETLINAQQLILGEIQKLETDIGQLKIDIQREQVLNNDASQTLTSLELEKAELLLSTADYSQRLATAIEVLGPIMFPSTSHGAPHEKINKFVETVRDAVEGYDQSEWFSFSHVERIKKVTEKIRDLIDRTVEESKESREPIVFERGNEDSHRENVVNAAMTFVMHTCPNLLFNFRDENVNEELLKGYQDAIICHNGRCDGVDIELLGDSLPEGFDPETLNSQIPASVWRSIRSELAAGVASKANREMSESEWRSKRDEFEQRINRRGYSSAFENEGEIAEEFLIRTFNPYENLPLPGTRDDDEYSKTYDVIPYDPPFVHSHALNFELGCNDFSSACQAHFMYMSMLTSSVILRPTKETTEMLSERYFENLHQVRSPTVILQIRQSDKKGSVLQRLWWLPSGDAIHLCVKNTRRKHEKMLENHLCHDRFWSSH